MTAGALAASQAPGDARRPAGFGTQVRLLRVARGLTAAALATRCGVSRSLISQVETGRISPSLHVVRQLAAALEVPIGALFAPSVTLPAPAAWPRDDGASPPDVLSAPPPGGAEGREGPAEGRPERHAELVRRDERKGLRLPRSKITYELLSPDLKGRLQVQWVELAPGETGPADGFVHAGEECYVVLAGRIRFRIGEREFVLGPGDALTFDSSVPHAATNDGPETAVAISAMTPPSF
jgi:transcriptional regulator with XRE-family HTH domain